MRSLATLSALLTACWITSAQAQEASPQPGSLDAISWLLGDWAFTDGPTTTGESWQRASATTWEGYGFMVRGGDTSRTEDLRLWCTQGDIFYVSKVEHNALPVAFKLVSWSDSTCVFENAGHDFPQRIRYTKTGVGLTARIEGVSKGKERSADYPFRKVERTQDTGQGAD